MGQATQPSAHHFVRDAERDTDRQQTGPDQADAGSAYLWMMADKQMEEDSEQ